MGRCEELGILLGQAKLRGIPFKIISLSVNPHQFKFKFKSEG